MMKSQNFLFALILTSGIFFAGCRQDNETPGPVIVFSELGYENSKIGYPGADFHMEAEILAEGRIDYIEVEVHKEGDHETKTALFLPDEDEWKFDSLYTKFNGLKNTLFHEHFDVPVFADTGHYHFHFAVTDMEGYQTVFGEEIEIRTPLNMEASQPGLFSAFREDEVYARGKSSLVPIW
jgi:hypothetical protein